MPRTYVNKKRIEQIDPTNLTEPNLTADERASVERGRRLFNERRFWDAHEAWEEVWKERTEESRIFFQGIIQAAAGYHLIVEKQRLGGATKNLQKAYKKLEVFPKTFLGFDVEALRQALIAAQQQLAVHGPLGIEHFPTTLIPVLNKV